MAIRAGDILPRSASNSLRTVTSSSLRIGNMPPAISVCRTKDLSDSSAKRVLADFLRIGLSHRGLRIDTSTAQLFDDHCAQINALTVALEETWFSTRFGAVSESRIVVKAVSPLQTVQLGQEMQTLSTNCSALLPQFRRQKARP